MIALATYLRAGENLGQLARERSDVLRHMIADLKETGNFRDRGDAVRQLHGDAYPTIDIMILVDEAMFCCQQDEIARMMSDQDMDHRSSADDGTPSGHHTASL